MNSRQRLAYKAPLWTNKPWTIEPEYQHRVALRGLTVCTVVRMNDSYHGERPYWHVSVGPVNAEGNYIELAALTDEQLEAMRALGLELLEGVSIEPCRIIEGDRTFEIFKGISDVELEGLPLEIRDTRLAIRKVASRRAV